MELISWNLHSDFKNLDTTYNVRNLIELSIDIN